MANFVRGGYVVVTDDGVVHWFAPPRGGTKSVAFFAAPKPPGANAPRPTIADMLDAACPDRDETLPDETFPATLPMGHETFSPISVVDEPPCTPTLPDSSDCGAPSRSRSRSRSRP